MTVFLKFFLKESYKKYSSTLAQGIEDIAYSEVLCWENKIDAKELYVLYHRNMPIQTITDKRIRPIL